MSDKESNLNVVRLSKGPSIADELRDLARCIDEGSILVSSAMVIVTHSQMTRVCHYEYGDRLLASQWLGLLVFVQHAMFAEFSSE